MNSQRGKALIADDHGLYRAGLSFLLRDHLGFSETVEAAGFDEALDRMAETPGITLALFDLSMPGMGGPESLVVIRETYPGARVAVVSASEDRSHVLATISAGLAGFVSKSLSDVEIVQALEVILAGGVYAPAGLPPSTLPSHVAEASPQARLEDLTPRQRDVLAGILRGLSNKEIARELCIAEGTVKIHLAALFSQLGARNRTDLATRSQVLFGWARTDRS